VSGGPVYTSGAAGRGLYWDNTSRANAGARRRTFTGDKISTYFDGAQKGTIEVVLTIPSPQPGDQEQIFGINQFDAEGDAFSIWWRSSGIIIDSTGQAGVFPTGYAAKQYFDAGDPPPSGLHVLHFALDFTAATRDGRMKLYLDGVDQESHFKGYTSETTDTLAPRLNDAINIPYPALVTDPGQWIVGLGCFEQAAYYDGSATNQTIWYVAAFDDVITAGESATRATAFLAHNDPTGGTMTFDDPWANGAVSGGAATANGGTLVIKTAGGTTLATITLQNPAFGSASGRAVAINGTPQATAVATGTAAVVELYNSSATRLGVGTVTATGGGGDLTLASTSITSGQLVRVTSLAISQP
jgi:hypothetical protein